MFVLVHCPLERLLAESEQIKLIMKLKDVRVILDSFIKRFNVLILNIALIFHLKRLHGNKVV